MKVFYVMVLVLVAGAVPSHGRTESVGTVFNKTQPHESMNNVTVSSSKFRNYDTLYLVMQWPKTFCNFLSTADRQCYQQPPRRFTVHGLWPQAAGVGIDCTNDLMQRLCRPFDGRQLGGQVELVRRLNQWWPDLATPYNYIFWRNEYNKHGSCTFPNQYQYFTHTLTLVDSLERRLGNRDLVTVLSELPTDQRIVPGGSYRSTFIKNAVQRVTRIIPMLRCVSALDKVQLLEIRFCAYRNSNELRDCSPRYVGCGNGRVLLPPPP